MRKNLSTKWFVREIDEDKVYFNYKRAPYLRSKWPVVIVVLIEVTVLVSELVLNHSAYLQVLTVLLMLHYLYRILKHKEEIDKTTESMIVEEQMARVHPGSSKATVAAKEYFIVTPNEVYLREKRFLLVIMSDGKVYRYGVEPAEKNGFILDKRASLCKDESELVLVKEYTDSLKKEGKMRKMKRNASIAAAVILAIGIAFIGLMIWLGGTTSWMKIVGWVVFAIFALSLVITLSLSSYEGKKGSVGAVYRASSRIFAGLWLLVQLVFPSLLLMMGFMFIVLFPFAFTFMTLKAVSTVVTLNANTTLFLSLSLGAIISAYYSKPLFGWLSRGLTANGHRYEKYFKEMVEYVYQPANIQFVVYFLYVVYLVIATIFQFQTDGKPLFGNGRDMAVLESFLVFIAFSNMKMRREKASFSFSELFRMMWGMWTTHDNVKEDE